MCAASRSRIFAADGAREVLSVKLEASLLDYVTDDESGKGAGGQQDTCISIAFIIWNSSAAPA